MLYRVALMQTFELESREPQIAVTHLGVFRVVSLHLHRAKSGTLDRLHAYFSRFTTVLRVQVRPARLVLLSVVVHQTWCLGLRHGLPLSHQVEKAPRRAGIRLELQHKFGYSQHSVFFRSNVRVNDRVSIVNGRLVENGFGSNLDVDGDVCFEQIHLARAGRFLHIHGLVEWSTMFGVPLTRNALVRRN